MDKKIEIPAEIRSFLETLLHDGDMTNLSEVVKENMLYDLFDRLDSFVTTRIVENLPEDKLEAFITMAQEGKGKDDMQKFLHENIDNSAEVFAKAMVQFRELYLGNISANDLEEEEKKKVETVMPSKLPN